MVTAPNRFQPDYAVPPGWILEERLEANGISQAEFARRCGRSAKFISEVVAGKAPIEAKTALQFEKVLGVSANIWLGIEKRYRLHQVREAEAREAEASVDWARGFPVGELVKRGAIRKVSSAGDKVAELLAFFRVASVRAWENRYEEAEIAYRHSPSFESDKSALAAWLRLAEIEAERQETAEFDKAVFKAALTEVRGTTRLEVSQALEAARRRFNHAGVALVWVKPLRKTRLSGAAWWLSPRKPVIALTGRYMSDDHLWFSLFHEAAHILLHSKKCVFVDEDMYGIDEDEAQANEWAEKFIVPSVAFKEFALERARFSERDVRDFAFEQGVAPGIVVGRLQHEYQLPKSHLNGLKVRLKWSDDGSRLYSAGSR